MVVEWKENFFLKTENTVVLPILLNVIQKDPNKVFHKSFKI
jgi:hypothetical protein